MYGQKLNALCHFFRVLYFVLQWICHKRKTLFTVLEKCCLISICLLYIALTTSETQNKPNDVFVLNFIFTHYNKSGQNPYFATVMENERA